MNLWAMRRTFFVTIQSQADFRKKCESCLHERTLLTGNLFGEKPHRDEAKRNRDEVGIVANAFRSEDFCVGVLRFFVKGETELCA